MTDSFFANLFFRNYASKDAPLLFPTTRSQCFVIHPIPTAGRQTFISWSPVIYAL